MLLGVNKPNRAAVAGQRLGAQLVVRLYIKPDGAGSIGYGKTFVVGSHLPVAAHILRSAACRKKVGVGEIPFKIQFRRGADAGFSASSNTRSPSWSAAPAASFQTPAYLLVCSCWLSLASSFSNDLMQPVEAVRIHAQSRSAVNFIKGFSRLMNRLGNLPDVS